MRHLHIDLYLVLSPTISFDIKQPIVCSGSADTIKANLILAGVANIGNTTTTGTGTGQTVFAGGWGGTKTQYIIRASELTALGLSAGNINSIGMTPTTSGATYEGVQMWLGKYSYSRYGFASSR